MNNDEINSGLDALQAAHEKRISGDLQVLEDSEELLYCASYLEHQAKYLDYNKNIKKWASLLRRIAIPRPVGERE